MSCQIYGMTTIECTLCEHSIVMNKKFSVHFSFMTKSAASQYFTEYSTFIPQKESTIRLAYRWV